MPEAATEGRRDRKRAVTRQTIADAALELFRERGFDQVSVSEVADRADVATATVFNYFPSKEALVFDRDDEFDRDLANAIRERPEGESVIEALRGHALATWVPLALDPSLAARRALINETPALRAYSERSWLGHTRALGETIADALGRPHDDIACLALARYVLNIPALTGEAEDVGAAVRTIFDLLADGWNSAISEDGRRARLRRASVHR